MKFIYQILYYITNILTKFVLCMNMPISSEKIENDIISSQYKIHDIYVETTFLDAPISKKEYDLSLIVPVYNAEKHIKKCIDSLISQNTKYEYQIILINDGSSDNSYNILKDYEVNNKNIFVIDQKNGGISNARNRGIRVASGKYVGFVDNDDWVTSDYVEKLLSRAYKTDADIVKCNHINYSVAEDKPVAIIRHDDTSVVGDFDLSIMSFKGYVWGGIIKRSLFDSVRFPEQYWYEDTIMRSLIMRLSNRYEYINEALYYYALHENNASKKIWKKNDIKCLDFFYLMRFITVETDKLGLEKNSVYRNIILYEFGVVLWQRTRNLDKKTRIRLFENSCQLLQNEKISLNDSLYGSNKYFVQAFLNNNFYLWQIAALQAVLKLHTNFV